MLPPCRMNKCFPIIFSIFPIFSKKFRNKNRYKKKQMQTKHGKNYNTFFRAYFGNPKYTAKSFFEVLEKSRY
jgi:hypothetical protein